MGHFTYFFCASAYDLPDGLGDNVDFNFAKFLNLGLERANKLSPLSFRSFTESFYDRSTAFELLDFLVNSGRHWTKLHTRICR